MPSFGPRSQLRMGSQNSDPTRSPELRERHDNYDPHTTNPFTRCASLSLSLSNVSMLSKPTQHPSPNRTHRSIIHIFHISHRPSSIHIINQQYNSTASLCSLSSSHPLRIFSSYHPLDFLPPNLGSARHGPAACIFFSVYVPSHTCSIFGVSFFPLDDHHETSRWA